MASSGYLTWKQMQKILEQNGDLLLSMLQIDAKFLSLLVKEGAITSIQSDDIRANPKPSDAKQDLFSIIKTNLESFLSFCIILHRTLKRDDIVRDEFKLKIRDLERQKKEIEDRRRKEEEEDLEDGGRKEEKDDKREEQAEAAKQSQETNEPAANGNNTSAYKELTYKDVKQLLIDHKAEFYDRFEPTNRVLAELRRVNVINADTENTLKRDQKTPNDRKDTILETVMRKGVRVFLDFCIVLCDDDIQQEHLVNDVLKLNISHIQKQREKMGV